MNKRIFISLSLLLIAASILSLSGWLFQMNASGNLFLSWTKINFNTALCILFSATVVLLFQLRPTTVNRMACTLLSALLLGIGLSSSIQYFFPIHTGIDELFVQDLTTEVNPGRMSFATGITFSLLATCFLVLKSAKRVLLYISQYVLHFITLISGFSLISFLYRIPSLQKFGAINPMDFQTSIALIILSSIASFVNHKLGITSILSEKKTGSVVSKKIFYKMTLLIIVVGVVRHELMALNIITEEFEITSLIISFIFISLFVIIQAARLINNIDSQRSQAEETLGIVNYSLSKIILDRTKELNQALERLRESESRLKSIIGKYSEG